MKPYLHAKGSVRRWGGKREDYQAIHDFIDSSKMAMPDMRHRAALHNAFGCFVVERVFGHTITNSDGKEVSTRDIAEAHVIEDLGFLPSLEDFLDEMPMSKWHGGIHRLAKDERPPTPAETRLAARGRVEEAIYRGIRSGALLLGQEAIGIMDDEDDKRYDAAINNVIAAFTGASEHQDPEE